MLVPLSSCFIIVVFPIVTVHYSRPRHCVNLSHLAFHPNQRKVRVQYFPFWFFFVSLTLAKPNLQSQRNNVIKKKEKKKENFNIIVITAMEFTAAIATLTKKLSNGGGYSVPKRSRYDGIISTLIKPMLLDSPISSTTTARFSVPPPEARFRFSNFQSSTREETMTTFDAPSSITQMSSTGSGI